jgi:hypothetical protein
VVADDLFVYGEDEHQGVLGDGHRVRAAVVGDRHARLAGGFDVEAVVAGADELHELQIRRRVVERLPHVLARKAHEVLGVLNGLRETRVVLGDDLKLEIGRRHGAGDVHDRGRERG